MNVERIYPSGYCKGVINAINLAYKTRKDNPNEKIYVLGMIVHNSYVTHELEALNITTLDDSSKDKEALLDEIKNGIVIFTAHGIADSIKEKAIKKGLKIVDATCEDVLKTQEIIKKYINDGFEVIYLGKDKHPEALAVLAISSKIHLVTSIKDLEELNLEGKLLLTCQTTMSTLELNDVILKVKEKYPDIVIKNDICLATYSRQKAIMDLDDCELLYVVGDIKSNNTNMLKNIALTKIKNVHLISDYKEINDNDLKGIKKVYITAGASTPPQLIDEVFRYLESY